MCGVEYNATPVTTNDAFNLGAVIADANGYVRYYLQ